MSWKCNILGTADGFFDVAEYRMSLVKELGFRITAKGRNMVIWQCGGAE